MVSIDSVRRDELRGTSPDVAGPLGPSTRRASSQLAACVAGALVYFGLRLVVEGGEQEALANAERMMSLEEDLGLDHERSLQSFADDHGWFRWIGNFSYTWFHWPLIAAALAFTYYRDRARYFGLRNGLFLSGLVGVVLFAVFPEAPPRFIPDHVGTVSDVARRLYLGFPLSWSNPYAAFPSFHVGWTLVACLAVAGLFEARGARLLVLLPAAAVGVAVVSTGNHYLLDAVAGTVIALAAYGFARRRLDGPIGSSEPEPVPDTGARSPTDADATLDTSRGA